MKKLLMLLLIIYIINPIASATIFSDDFETGDFSKWSLNSASCFILEPTEKGLSTNVKIGCGGGYLEKNSLTIPTDFEWNYDFRISGSYEADVGIYNTGSGYSAMYEMDIVDNTAYFYWRDAGLNYQFNISTVDLSGNVDANGWVNTGISKNGNIISVKINDVVVEQIILTNPYTNTINAFFVYGYSTNDFYDNFLLNPAGAVVTYAPSGYVRDTNNAAISGATVTLYNNTYSQSVLTDSTGHYSMTLPANGTYTYLAAKNGYINSTETNQTFTNGGTTLTNTTLTKSTIPYQAVSSIQFDRTTYNVGDTILITAYAAKAGTIQLIDSKGQIKINVPIAAQTASNQSYKILSGDQAGIWQGYLKESSGSIAATTNAKVNVPNTAVTTPIPGLTSTPTISTCPSGVCEGVSWTIDDVFMWMRIYVPKLTELTLVLYIIALFGSFKNMVPRQTKPRQSWRK